MAGDRRVIIPGVSIPAALVPDLEAHARRAFLEAAAAADWTQVALNGGPPCFWLLKNGAPRFCLAAERWAGHHGEGRQHPYIPLQLLLEALGPR